MANRLYTEYTAYPGRQIYYMVVPRKYEPIFFEGVQSIDAASNADEVTHGQFGYKGDVIISKNYKNSSGKVSLKEFNNASFVLRAMTGVSPNASFIFDPSRLEHVDVFANVWNKTRDRVMRSTWLVDFMPSVSESETLDDIQTKDLDYTAVRKIDFEGHQIVCQAFTDTRMGDTQFKLMWKATVDPTVQLSEVDPVTGLTVGVGRHELCPIQWMLRVWVDGTVLDDPDDATVVTKVNGAGELESTLILKQPLSKDGQMVKAMWLADGTDMVLQKGVTSAPVMVSAEQQLTVQGGGLPPLFEGHMKVFFSKRMSDTALAALVAADFELTFEHSNVVYKMNPIAPPTVDANVKTSNMIILDFTGATSAPVGGTYEAGDTAVLRYQGTVLKDTEGFVTPIHSITLKPF